MTLELVALRTGVIIFVDFAHYYLLQSVVVVVVDAESEETQQAD